VPPVPIERHTLGNGLRVILSRDDSAPVVAVNLWYDVGSKHERPGRTGFAHLFEHMMFQGSVNVAKGEHFSYVQSAGGTLNATTWLDRTNFFETVPGHELELALWLEADRMARLLPAMTQEKLDNQREVVKNERRWSVDNQPYGTWDEKLQELVYPESHPYHHSTIGSMEDLGAASLHDVGEFFSTFYCPNNAVLSIVGGFDPDAAMTLVERHMGPIPANPNLPAPPDMTLDPFPLGAEAREVVVDQVPLPRVYLAYRIPTFGPPAAPAACTLGWCAPISSRRTSASSPSRSSEERPSSRPGPPLARGSSRSASRRRCGARSRASPTRAPPRRSSTGSGTCTPRASRRRSSG
jgi:predicted Zn-dependent peptidase